MARLAALKSPITGLIACLALLGANVAKAEQSTVDQAAHAREVAWQALEDGQAGRNEQACQGFKNAAILYKNAILSLYSASLSTPDDRKYVTDTANFLQSHADSAKEGAEMYCGLNDEPVQATTSSNDFDNDAETKLDLQRTETLAKAQYQDAVRKYDANDFAGACTSARLSAVSYGKIVTALKANGALESAFANADQIYANARQAATDRDEFYCTK